ncbi:MAG: histone deacetylase, partial [Rhodospirillales bacterium]|nr:histone deacetylase [Rhodospirillales bacterium]
MPKFGMLRTLLERDLRDQIHIVEADEANEEQLKLVHDADYVRAFMDGCLDVDAVRRIGLPWSRALVRRTLLEVGGTIMAMRTAIERGIACNAAGGTHHAHRTFGSGFCIFNDLAVAARVA